VLAGTICGEEFGVGRFVWRVLALILFGASVGGLAQKAPAAWYTDVGRGLMWSKQPKRSLKFQAAVQYCTDLRLGGYSDWRMPTIVELDTATVNTTVYHTPKKGGSRPEIAVSFVWGKAPLSGYVWSSTSDASKRMVVEDIDAGGHAEQGPTASFLEGISYTFCVRSSAGDRATPQIQAQQAVSVSQTASQVGNYPGALDFAKQALALDPGSADALDALGVAEGHLGQWADAVTQIEAALKVNGKNAGYKADLKWAKKGLAQSGGK
jgi:hypothetical protein